MSDLGDWQIDTSNAGSVFLYHVRCPKSGAVKYRRVYCHKILKEWVCSRCKKIAPEEIAFIADLAFTNPVEDKPCEPDPPDIEIVSKYHPITSLTHEEKKALARGFTLPNRASLVKPIIYRPAPKGYNDPYDGIIKPGEAPEQNPSGFIINHDGTDFLN